LRRKIDSQCFAKLGNLIKITNVQNCTCIEDDFRCASCYYRSPFNLLVKKTQDCLYNCTGTNPNIAPAVCDKFYNATVNPYLKNVLSQCYEGIYLSDGIAQLSCPIVNDPKFKSPILPQDSQFIVLLVGLIVFLIIFGILLGLKKSGKLRGYEL